MSWINLAVAVLGWRIRCARKMATSAPDAHGTSFHDESKHVYRHPPRLTYRTFERSLCRIGPNPSLVFCSECRCAMPSFDGLLSSPRRAGSRFQTVAWIVLNQCRFWVRDLQCAAQQKLCAVDCLISHERAADVFFTRN